MTRFGWQVLVGVALGAFVMALVLGALGLSAMRSLLLGWNVATLLAYGYDKLLARSGQERVPELALHLLSLCGGSPGAFVGMVLFRHKTRDQGFRLLFFAIVALQVLVLLVFSCRRQSKASSSVRACAPLSEPTTRSANAAG